MAASPLAITAWHAGFHLSGHRGRVRNQHRGVVFGPRRQYGVAVVARQEGSRWWTYPCLMLVTLGITRFREPAA